MYSIDDFINEVQGALRSWTLSHSLDGWIDNEEYLYLRDAEQYLLDAYQKDIAEDLHNDGMFYCHCGWNGDSYEVFEYNRCPDCGLFCSKYDIDMCLILAIDIYYDIDSIDLTSLPSWVLESAYEAWIAEVFPMIPELIADAEEALDQIDSADDQAELLAAVLMACHCCHVGGVIVIDHGGIEGDLMDQISYNGLSGLFGEEEVNLFLGI